MFTVRVADNYHYMDPDEIYTHGDFPTWIEALDAARNIVDSCLANYFEPGISADALYEKYRAFGDDPFIAPEPDGEKFSAWDYARERCAQLCGSE
jgi:hypothetical protein